MKEWTSVQNRWTKKKKRKYISLSLFHIFLRETHVKTWVNRHALSGRPTDWHREFSQMTSMWECVGEKGKKRTRLLFLSLRPFLYTQCCPQRVQRGKRKESKKYCEAKKKLFCDVCEFLSFSSFRVNFSLDKNVTFLGKASTATDRNPKKGVIRGDGPGWDGPDVYMLPPASHSYCPLLLLQPLLSYPPFEWPAKEFEFEFKDGRQIHRQQRVGKKKKWLKVVLQVPRVKSVKTRRTKG